MKLKMNIPSENKIPNRPVQQMRRSSIFDKDGDINLFLLNGIGDYIYTYYILCNLVKNGYKLNIHTTDATPQRLHQITGCLEGCKSFKYLSGFKQERYRRVPVIDIFNPNPKCMFNGIPVLHINSWLEDNIHMKKFLPKYPIIYDVELNTNQEAKCYAKENIDGNYFNIALYCSSYANNKYCHMHPDPVFWCDLAENIYKIFKSNKDLNINLFGANYDYDLTLDVYNELNNRNVKCNIHIDNEFYNVIEMIRISDFVITYESGFNMISDVLGVNCLGIFRDQRDGRDNRLFPYLGVVNPDDIWKNFFPFFFDDDIKTIINKMSEVL